MREVLLPHADLKEPLSQVHGPTQSTSVPHPVELLFAAMRAVQPFPKGVVALRARLPGTGFFPGGAGLWGAKFGEPLPVMPINGIMVLGHDFHSEEAFAKSLAQSAEVSSSPSNAGHRRVPTWAALLRLFEEVKIGPERCFFTNAYMGLREGSGTTGRFPGAEDAEFVARCREFFLRQLAAQQPLTILTLGAWVPAFLAPLAGQLADWVGVRSLSEIDRRGPVRHYVEFASSVTPCSVVALTHPSLRGSNVHRRRYGDLFGHAAEVKMVREALAQSGVDAGVV